MQLRPYQTTDKQAIYQAWQDGHRDVLYVLACGGGKTCVFSEIINEHSGASVAIAHRQELVSQMSLTLARNEIRHRIIGPQNVIRSIIQAQILEFGRDFYDPAARCAVAGVDTLVRRSTELDRWLKQVTLWVTDEAHHLIGNGKGTGNKWGKAVAMFPNARGLGVTATPERADGKGLGRCSDGVFDIMIEGPGMRDLIGAGYLTDYRIFCPPSDLDLATVAVGADGDFVRGQLALKTRASTIMGHVTESYLKIAPGKLGVTFAPDIETATEFNRMFNAAGVPSEILTAKTPTNVRQEILRRFRNRKLLQLVTVDLISEGFDLPAIEVVSMARATQSYGLFVQQFGRGCRLLDGKDTALIIDHTSNIIRHGLPDRPHKWSLDRRDYSTKKEKDPDIIPMRICCNPLCIAPFPRTALECPFCGMEPVPGGRTSPEMVDGDMYEIDPETLALMRGEIAKVDRSADDVKHGMERSGANQMVANSVAKRHRERQEAQAELRSVMAWYGGWQKAIGNHVRVAQRTFYHQFGIDIMSAQSLGKPEAEELRVKIVAVLQKAGVTI
jgi:DNA repair protein RadD